MGNHHGDIVNSQITQNLAEVWNWNSFGFCKARSQGLKASTNNSVLQDNSPLPNVEIKMSQYPKLSNQSLDKNFRWQTSSPTFLQL